MSLDTRNNSALFKRAEQLKRWEESDTNREPTVPKNVHGRRIKFSSGCVFLAACMAGDKDEVLRLLEDGADIDTANVDGLTALHQACIDDNLEMVEFLVQQGSDINRPDNEGWTPLHATSSCGFISIARYLIENNSDLAAINSDGDLAIDLAANDGMEDLLQKHIDEQNIDCEEARQSEQRLMLNDAKKWLRSDATEADRPHPRTGATALHVAAAKGYTKVLSLLLAGRADVDKQDNDGWTPLHAAAHWGQKEAAQMLVTALADMDIKNYAGQNPLDIAHPDIMRFLEDLRKNNKRRARKSAIQKITDSMDNHIETPPKVIRVEVKTDLKEGDEERLRFLERISESDCTSDSENDTDSTESSHSTSISDDLDEKPKPPSEPAAPIPKDKNIIEDDAPWRRSGSLRSRTQPESPPKTQVPEKEVPAVDSDIILRRTQSFENDEKFYQKYRELQARIKANSCPVLVLPATPNNIVSGGVGCVNTTNNFIVQRSASLKDHRQLRKTPGWPPANPTAPVVSTPSSTNVRRSFVPPARDEESETQRKAHAKRVRETRRSTQGVTLDEIKSAEELVKKKNMTNNNNTNQNENSTSTTTSSSLSTTHQDVKNDRVPSTKNLNEECTTSATIETIVTQQEPVTANLTINLNKKIDNDVNSDKISSSSASYTISPSSPLLTNTINSSTSSSEESKDKNDITTEATTKTKPSTINVPTNNKTDLNDTIKITPTSPTTNPTNNFNIENKINKIDDINIENKIIGQNTDRLLRDKRSLFDIDNASSLTLADKLRNEANKYNDTKSNNDVTLNNNIEQTSDTLDNDKDIRKTDSTPSSPLHHITTERRPSWRLKLDTGNKFKLEDASNTSPNISPSEPVVPTMNTTSNISSIAQRRQNNITGSNTALNSTPRPVSAPVISQVTEINDKLKGTIANDISQSRRLKSSEDKENDKENDSRSAQATQAAIQRRKRPKRRSTGVVHLDKDELDPDHHESPVDGDDKESGSEFSTRSRLGSTNSLNDRNDDTSGPDSAENGEFLDYKALWEASKIENDKLKIQLKKKDDEIHTSKATLDRFTNATTKNSLSEIEKRERRAMERKMSEMEEELKLLHKYKTENERLRAENRALTRVVSKLTISAQNQLHKKHNWMHLKRKIND